MIYEPERELKKRKTLTAIIGCWIRPCQFLVVGFYYHQYYSFDSIEAIMMALRLAGFDETIFIPREAQCPQFCYYNDLLLLSGAKTI